MNKRLIDPTVLSQLLTLPQQAMLYALSLELRVHDSGLAMVETDIAVFDVEGFCYAGLATLANAGFFPNQTKLDWDYEDKEITTEACQAWRTVNWQGEEIEILTVSYAARYRTENYHYLLGKSEKVLERFVATVTKWASEVRGEVLVFSDGCWLKNSRLFKQIQAASLDDLVLQGSLKEEIVADFQGFFAAKETYARYGIAWKRGVLLLGSPGNGKTHMIKALGNTLGVPILYVRNFESQHSSDSANMSAVFNQARSVAPCLLVFEDLDALLHDRNRSFFLNEMDGFYANDGILTVATTNHPERLDPAILDRPSRFDRKYTFALPELEERRRFLARVNESLESELQLSPDEIDIIAGLTTEFSFAYLKELFLSSLMAWISGGSVRPMADIMGSQVGSLREQMRVAHASDDSAAEQILEDE